MDPIKRDHFKDLTTTALIVAFAIAAIVGFWEGYQ